MRLMYAVVAIGLAACGTDEDDGSVDATINTVAWRADKVTATRDGTTFSVSGSSSPYPKIGISGVGVNGPGSYPVTDNIFAQRAAGFSVLDRTGIALTDAGGSGSLVITSWSDAQVAGTFSFTAGQGSSLHVVSGAFTATF